MKKYIKLLLVITWMILIFILSSFNRTESSNQSLFIVEVISKILSIENKTLLHIIIRDIAHIIEYLILGILVYNYLKGKKKDLLVSIIICILYSISDEIHQIYVPGRSFQYIDILFDSIGSIIGIFIIKKISR